MSISSTPTQGYPLLEGWTFTIAQGGQTGTKVYLVGSTDMTGMTRESLPRIGDAWGAGDANVTCKSITKTFVDGCQTEAKWRCEYNTTPFNESSAALSVDDLSRSVDVGGEFIAFEPKASSGWKWDTSGAIVKQPIFKNCVQATIRIPVIIGNFANFFSDNLDIAGKISNATFLGVPEGNVLFLGSNMTEYKNAWGARRWRAELNFAVRSLADDEIPTAGNHWQYNLNQETGLWDQPMNSAGAFLYETADLDTLFDHSLGDEEDMYPAPPDR